MNEKRRLRGPTAARGIGLEWADSMKTLHRKGLQKDVAGAGLIPAPATIKASFLSVQAAA
jgi:hypothetical protein